MFGMKESIVYQRLPMEDESLFDTTSSGSLDSPKQQQYSYQRYHSNLIN
jgi:hypothetical protein